jgi:hypothetical protein
LLQRRGAREVGGLLVLFFLLIGFAAFYEQVGQERVASDAPTTSNTQAEGVRALYLLYGREAIRAEPLKAPWSELGPNDGLLIFVEPPSQERPVTRPDMTVLEKWIRAGGTLLDLVSDPPIEQPQDPTNLITGDSGATAGDPALHEVPVEPSAASPLVADVHAFAVSSKQRLTLAKGAPYRVLARDAAGIVAIEKALGQGRVVLVANRFGATNAGIAQADNAVFLVNLARVATSGGRRAVRFDDYHHGAGFAVTDREDGGGLWENVPHPLRLAVFHLAALALLLLYNGNRRFGPAIAAIPISARASTDYVNSMARLYRRAGAGDIAAETLYSRFLRDLRKALDVPNEAGIGLIIRAAEQKFGPQAAGLQGLLMQGEAVAAGQRLTERDMLHLAEQIEQLRRTCQLVGV